jgi:hypothetical protein
MDDSSAAPGQAPWGALRRQRAELRDSMSALELALAGAVSLGRARWGERVHVALVELSADFRGHVEFTEAGDGLYVEVLATAPRLAGAVTHLTQEHGEITGLLEDLLTRTRTRDSLDVDHVRASGTRLLGMLVTHRQRGSDLVYEAFEYDIGGET